MSRRKVEGTEDERKSRIKGGVLTDAPGTHLPAVRAVYGRFQRVSQMASYYGKFKSLGIYSRKYPEFTQFLSTS